jgi:hypothetical protein
MPEAREEDEVEQVLIPLKNVSPAIPKSESELKKLVEDLTRMGCEGLLAKPWNLRSETTLKEWDDIEGVRRHWGSFSLRGGTNGSWLSGRIRRSGRQRYGRKFMGLLPRRTKGGPAARIISMWGSSEGSMIRKTDSTPEIAETIESGGW